MSDWALVGEYCAKCKSTVDCQKIEGGALWTHWLLYSIPPTVTSLPEELPATATLDNGAAYSINDYGNALYSGPCPEPTVNVPPLGCQGTGSGCSNKETIPAKQRVVGSIPITRSKALDTGLPGMSLFAWD